MKHISVLVIFILLLSCDPCPDCGDPITSEPTVEMVFIYQDSINAIDEVLIDLDSLDSAFTSINALLEDFRDSLQALNDSIDLGLTEYIDERDAVLDTIPHIQMDSLFLETLEIEDSISALSSTRATINSGNILVNEIRFPEINESLTYTEEDSADIWLFPLSFEKSFTIYEVLIQDETLVIELDYETFTEVDEERNVRIRAENIQLVETTGVDSVIVCEQNCVDGEASFTFYF